METISLSTGKAEGHPHSPGEEEGGKCWGDVHLLSFSPHIHSSIPPSTYPSIHPSTHSSIHPFLRPSIYHPSIHPPIHQSIQPSIHLPTLSSTHPLIHVLITVIHSSIHAYIHLLTHSSSLSQPTFPHPTSPPYFHPLIPSCHSHAPLPNCKQDAVPALRELTSK